MIKFILGFVLLFGCTLVVLLNIKGTTKVLIENAKIVLVVSLSLVITVVGVLFVCYFL